MTQPSPRPLTLLVRTPDTDPWWVELAVIPAGQWSITPEESPRVAEIEREREAVIRRRAERQHPIEEEPSAHG